MTKSAPEAAVGGMVFQPDNYWNAGLAVQAFGYNGELRLYYPIESALDGSPRYLTGGKAFQVLFPGDVMIADSPVTLDIAERGLKAGLPIWWTVKDPILSNSTPGSMERLQAIIQRSGASIETRVIRVNGQSWLLQKAQRS